MFDTDVWNVWHRPVPDDCLWASTFDFDLEPKWWGFELISPYKVKYKKCEFPCLNWSVRQDTTNLTTSIDSVNSSALNTLDVSATQMAFGTTISKDYNMSVQAGVAEISWPSCDTLPYYPFSVVLFDALWFANYNLGKVNADGDFCKVKHLS